MRDVEGSEMGQQDGYSLTTRGIRITVRPFYLEEQSAPDEGRFVWAYRVEIANEGSVAVQLTHRSWSITDAMGRVQKVHGPGVVGEQPVIAPGETFEYTSGAPLPTPSGFMEGAYHMVVQGTGETFDAAIPAFSLDSPHQAMRLH
jgi:ApaG protein